MGATAKPKAVKTPFAPEIMEARPDYMPRLSHIPGPRRFGTCQNCERTEATAGLRIAYWREHDERDLPEDVLVCLCGECSADLIEPHPRLYAPVAERQPVPGLMTICQDCQHRKLLRCRHPDRKENGGKGLAITFPSPSVYHLNFGGGKGGQYVNYPPGEQTCAGREARKERGG